jgi:hypothetical protein
MSRIAPVGTFPDHVVVSIKEGGVVTYFDPSYGVTYTSLADFQNKAIAGFYIVKDVPIGGKVVRAMEIRKSPAVEPGTERVKAGIVVDI